MSKPQHIAVNARLLLKDRLEGIGRFSYEVLKRMVERNPEVRFSFFFDRPWHEDFIFGPNVEPHVLIPQARHPFLYYWFFHLSVTRKLRKLKPDLFFSPDGYLSLRTPVPQVPVFHDLAFEHYPEFISRIEAWYYRKYFPQYAQKAQQILTVSQYSKQDLHTLYKVPEEKIHVVYNGASEYFFPIDPAEQQQVREQYAEGKQYFHYVGAIHPRKNLDTLIQAFDQFKKQTGSPVKLLIVGRKAWNFEEVIHSYATSDYKEEIHFTGFVSGEELNRIYAASLCLCYVPWFEGFGIPVIEAMQSETAVICSNVSSLPEVAGDATLMVPPGSPESIAEAMAKVYQSPELRDQLIHKGRTQRTLFSWDKTYQKAWNILERL